MNSLDVWNAKMTVSIKVSLKFQTFALTRIRLAYDTHRCEERSNATQITTEANSLFHIRLQTACKMAALWGLAFPRHVAQLGESQSFVNNVASLASDES